MFNLMLNFMDKIFIKKYIKYFTCIKRFDSIVTLFNKKRILIYMRYLMGVFRMFADIIFSRDIFNIRIKIH